MNPTPFSTVSATPTLTWPGKHQAQPLPLPTVQQIEIFAPGCRLQVASCTQDNNSLLATRHSPLSTPNSFFLGDNRATLTYLLANGYASQVKLIYIDPPYDSGVNWGRKVRLRGEKALTMQTNAEHVFGKQEQYRDQWHENDYLQFMYDRLPLLRDLLCEEGSLWLHVDHRQVHHLRVLMQEIFGEENYLNTITWRSQTARGAKVNAFYFPYSSHFIEIFAKNRRAPTTWNPIKKQIIMSEAEAEREFMRDAGGFFRTSDPGTYSFASLKKLHQEGRLYAPFGGEIIVDETAQRIYGSKGGNIGVKYYLSELKSKLKNSRWAVERAIDNLWEDIPGLGTTPSEDLGYPTQKTEALLERIIRTSTNPGDLVLDCFMGSGTTLAVAQKLGRRWIGCDNNWGALLTARQRLYTIDSAAFVVYQVISDGDGLIPALASPTQPSPTPALPEREGVVTPSTVPPLLGEVRRGLGEVGVGLEAEIALTPHPTEKENLLLNVINVTSLALDQQLAAWCARHPHALDDWRMWVACIAIDNNYDGKTFCSTLVDVPLKKSEQVKGSYTIQRSGQRTGPLQQIAIRITDVLGGEILICKIVD